MSVATGTVKDEKVFCNSGRGDPPGRPYIGHPINVCYRRRAVFFHASDGPGLDRLATRAAHRDVAKSYLSNSRGSKELM